jgi:hypothetical protein
MMPHNLPVTLTIHRVCVGGKCEGGEACEGGQAIRNGATHTRYIGEPQLLDCVSTAGSIVNDWSQPAS